MIWGQDEGNGQENQNIFGTQEFSVSLQSFEFRERETREWGEVVGSVP